MDIFNNFRSSVDSRTAPLASKLRGSYEPKATSTPASASSSVLETVER
jgi:hypothetical protein